MSCHQCGKKKEDVSHKLLPYLTNRKKIDKYMKAFGIRYEIGKRTHG